MKKRYIGAFLSLVLLGAGFPATTFAQKDIFIHSHNDYQRRVPFYQAYAQQLSSVEADIFLSKDNQLLVAHDLYELPTASTLDELYINPLVHLFKQNGGKPWKDSDKKLQLLIELKTPATPTLDMVVQKLNAHPEVFNPAVNPYAVQIVITGEFVPKPADFSKYPAYIQFDGLLDEKYTPKQLARVAYISVPFFEYAQWNGKGTLVTDQKKKVEAVIDQIHAMGKPIRFWGTPDHVTAWNTFHTMGVDIINTDVPELCADFFHNFDDKNFVISPDHANAHEGITKTDRLDKTTAGFQGFDNKKLQLSKGIEIYQPAYLNDGIRKPVKNIIFLIGDGMGLAQINAAASVNKGLSLFGFKYLGLQKNSSKDAFTTDSAAGGSALATGESNNNRHISMADDGTVYPSMSDVATSKGMKAGVVTWGNIADATPAAFYGHSTERDNADEITEWLLKGNLTLLNGSGMHILTDRKDKRDLTNELKSQYNITTSIDEINSKSGKVICIDERMEQAATAETIGLLAEATKESIKKLSENNKNGFFLMVEGAKIDYAGHANSLPGSVVEMLSFDMAIAEAMKFADSNGETLIVVTADHETGGLTLVDGDLETGKITARYMTDDHTPIMLPVFAYGPGSADFIGVYKNTQVFHKMKALLDANKQKK